MNDRRVARRSILLAVMVVGIGVAVIMGTFSFMTGQVDSGEIPFGQDAVPGVQERLALLTSTYERLTELVLAAFGVVAFLVTYQRERGAAVSTKAWVYLGAGLTLLVGALMLALLGREILLSMSITNAVDMAARSLHYTRWALYACLVFAAGCIGLYALDVTLAPREQEPENVGG